MSEDKTRAAYKAWLESRYLVEYPSDPTPNQVSYPWEAWKAATEACAAIKDAEYDAARTKILSQLSGVLQANKEQAAMIKDLREAITYALVDVPEEEDRSIEVLKDALAKSEYHNSRALEKMLLEARIIALEDAWQDMDNSTVYHIIELLDDARGKLAKLNINTTDNDVLATVVTGSAGPNTFAE